jgi:hypothetical protein
MHAKQPLDLQPNLMNMLKGQVQERGGSTSSRTLSSHNLCVSGDGGRKVISCTVTEEMGPQMGPHLGGVLTSFEFLLLYSKD